MHDFVYIICSDTGFGSSSSDIQDLSGQPTDLAHALLAFLIKDLNLFIHAILLLALGDAI